jgi:uroporphyrinogen-III synthase
VAFALDATLALGGVIFTSANAVRALTQHPAHAALINLMAFAVGAQTAEAARAAGFSHVISADADGAALRKVIVEACRDGQRKGKAAPLLYLAAEQVARDLVGELECDGMAVVRKTAYRMIPARGLPDDVVTAFAREGIELVLHYSAHSAQAFVDAVRRAGLEISALALPQACLSPAIAVVLREAGATRLLVAPHPSETALLDALPPPP